MSNIDKPKKKQQQIQTQNQNNQSQQDSELTRFGHTVTLSK
jgi:hypothetical protein